MECGEAERLALAVARARLARLAEYEGCRVKYCDRGGCVEGVLAWVDAESAAVAVKAEYGLVVSPFDPDGFELTVYRCPEGGGE